MSRSEGEGSKKVTVCEGVNVMSDCHTFLIFVLLYRICVLWIKDIYYTTFTDVTALHKGINPGVRGSGPPSHYLTKMVILWLSHEFIVKVSIITLRTLSWGLTHPQLRRTSDLKFIKSNRPSLSWGLDNFHCTCVVHVIDGRRYKFINKLWFD
jgi:hypothetical protein